MSEIEDLLHTIDESSPCGPDLRLEPGDLTLQQLKDLRSEFDPALAEDEGKEPQWSRVIQLCESTLGNRARDLEIIMALAEASVSSQGLAGLARSIELVEQSLARFWDSIHPGVDGQTGEISLPLRARWLNWMDSPKGFVMACKRAPLVTTEGGASYCWLDRENSALLDDATLSPERHQELLEAGVISEAQWEAAVTATPSQTLESAYGDLERSRKSLETLAASCQECFEADAEITPDFFHLRELLEGMRDYFGSRLHGSNTEPEGENATPDTLSAADAEQSGGAGGPIASRREALRRLGEVGEYFRRCEPHSPISYLIARAVRWGQMPLDDLLRDVVRNDEVIDHIWETLGLDSGREQED